MDLSLSLASQKCKQWKVCVCVKRGREGGGDCGVCVCE